MAAVIPELTLGIVAGEASGDQLAASVIEALKQRVGTLRVVGIGGDRMAAAGAELWSDYEPMAVMGLFEVLTHLPGLLRFRKDIKKRFLEVRPDIVLGIDSPDFNLGLERSLRVAGLRTAHLVSPSVWAWRPERVHTVAESVDQLLCLLPFEPALYGKLDLDARFVGHPLADELKPPADRVAEKRALIGDDSRLLAFLPGSRAGELKRLLPQMTLAVAELLVRDPSLKVRLPLAEERLRGAVEAALEDRGLSGRVEISVGDSRAVLAAADVALLASGTVALEAALLDCPMVVTYRLAGPSHWLLERLELLQVDRFALPNLIGDPDTVPELIQSDHRAELMVEAVEAVLGGGGVAQRDAFGAIRAALAKDSAARCADALLDAVQGQRAVAG